MERYLGRDKPKRHTLLEIFNEHNEKYRKLSGIDIAPGTVQRHLTCYRPTTKFIKKTYRKDDLYLDELSAQVIEDYEMYTRFVWKFDGVREGAVTASVEDFQIPDDRCQQDDRRIDEEVALLEVVQVFHSDSDLFLPLHFG